MPASGFRLALLTVAFVALAGHAWAQRPNQGQAGALRDACRSDYLTYCNGTQTGGGAAVACLQQHAPSLSPACGQAVSGMAGASTGGAALSQPAPAANAPPPVYAPQPAYNPPAYTPPAGPRAAQGGGLGGACAGDYRRFCSGVELGGGRVLACFGEHREELSPGCRQAMMSARGQQ